jgi:predicted dehydrogenase
MMKKTADASIRTMPNLPPRILLVGVGAFGKKHLATLLKLQGEGKLTLAGAVVKSEKSKRLIARKYGVRTSTKLTKKLLEEIEAVDIATPYQSHFKLVKTCLPLAHVFVEKPVTETRAEAEALAKLQKNSGKILMAGHIFRFHPVVTRFVELLSAENIESLSLEGTFLNAVDTDNDRDVLLELPHMIDIMNAIVGKKTDIVWAKEEGRVTTVDMRYPGAVTASCTQGWTGSEKIRRISCTLPAKTIVCDLVTNTIEITEKSGFIEKRELRPVRTPLEEELETFVRLVGGSTERYPDIRTGIELLEVIERARPKRSTAKRPKVAIIGAGLFGTNTAVELSAFCDVELFERNGDIMTESSFVNQYRHHWGYHYPRSVQTVQDIREAIRSFERDYNDAIIRDFPTYYCVAKKESHVSASEYIQFCQSNSLPFTLEYPDESFVDRSKVDVSLKTFEPIYDYKKLKQLVRRRLDNAKRVRLLLNTEITDTKLSPSGKKIMSGKGPEGPFSREFDYVINATYAHYNRFCHWLSFPIKPVRIDYVETLIVRLPIPKISLAIMDGPFANLVPTNEDSLFTLVHIKESIIERYVPADGLIKSVEAPSKMKEIMDKSTEWFPILKKAEVVDIRYVFRAVNAHREADDARPSDITYHGFGCWSILGGKIVNCISAAEKIVAEVKTHLP